MFQIKQPMKSVSDDYPHFTDLDVCIFFCKISTCQDRVKGWTLKLCLFTTFDKHGWTWIDFLFYWNNKKKQTLINISNFDFCFVEGDGFCTEFTGM